MKTIRAAVGAVKELAESQLRAFGAPPVERCGRGERVREMKDGRGVHGSRGRVVAVCGTNDRGCEPLQASLARTMGDLGERAGATRETTCSSPAVTARQTCRTFSFQNALHKPDNRSAE